MAGLLLALASLVTSLGLKPEALPSQHGGTKAGATLPMGGSLIVRSGGLGRHSCAACSAEPCAGAAVDAAAASPTARSIGAAFGAAVRAAFGAAAGAARHVRIASKQQS